MSKAPNKVLGPNSDKSENDEVNYESVSDKSVLLYVHNILVEETCGVTPEENKPKKGWVGTASIKKALEENYGLTCSTKTLNSYMDDIVKYYDICSATGLEGAYRTPYTIETKQLRNGPKYYKLECKLSEELAISALSLAEDDIQLDLASELVLQPFGRDAREDILAAARLNVYKGSGPRPWTSSAKDSEAIKDNLDLIAKAIKERRTLFRTTGLWSNCRKNEQNAIYPMDLVHLYGSEWSLIALESSDFHHLLESELPAWLKDANPIWPKFTEWPSDIRWPRRKLFSITADETFKLGPVIKDTSAANTKYISAATYKCIQRLCRIANKISVDGRNGEPQLATITIAKCDAREARRAEKQIEQKFGDFPRFEKMTDGSYRFFASIAGTARWCYRHSNILAISPEILVASIEGLHKRREKRIKEINNPE